jgi:hypothetical protein
LLGTEGESTGVVEVDAGGGGEGEAGGFADFWLGNRRNPRESGSSKEQALGERSVVAAMSASNMRELSLLTRRSPSPRQPLRRSYAAVKRPAAHGETASLRPLLFLDGPLNPYAALSGTCSASVNYYDR